MFSRQRLEPFPEPAIGESELAEAEADARICEALIELVERSNMSYERLAGSLGLDVEYLREIMLGQILDQPTPRLFLLAVSACGAKLKITLKQGGSIVI